MSGGSGNTVSLGTATNIVGLLLSVLVLAASAYLYATRDVTHDLRDYLRAMRLSRRIARAELTRIAEIRGEGFYAVQGRVIDQTSLGEGWGGSVTLDDGSGAVLRIGRPGDPTERPFARGALVFALGHVFMDKRGRREDSMKPEGPFRADREAAIPVLAKGPDGLFIVQPGSWLDASEAAKLPFQAWWALLPLSLVGAVAFGALLLVTALR